MVLAPNGHLLVSNSDGINPNVNEPSEIVEFTKSGTFIAQFSIDSAAGAAFGIAVAPLPVVSARLAAVDDSRNDLTVFLSTPLSTP